MTHHLKKMLPALYFFSLLTACNPGSETKTSEPKKDTDVATITDTTKQAPVVVPTTLKELTLNEKYLISEKKLSASKQIGKDLYKPLSIKLMDLAASGESGFKYHIIDTLFSKPGLKILLIGREYESENFAWVAIYDDQDKLINYKTVYADNAEGFLSIETVIKNNELAITVQNEYENDGKPKTEKFHLDENNKLVKLR